MSDNIITYEVSEFINRAIRQALENNVAIMMYKNALQSPTWVPYEPMTAHVVMFATPKTIKFLAGGNLVSTALFIQGRGHVYHDDDTVDFTIICNPHVPDFALCIPGLPDVMLESENDNAD